MSRSLRRAVGLSPILFALAFGAYAQDHSAADHAGHGAADPFAGAMAQMHQDMAVKPTGNVDADFVRGMIPHHQGAIEMARIVLEQGSDPEVRSLAQEVIEAQEGEIAWMRDWLEQNGFDQPGAQ